NWSRQDIFEQPLSAYGRRRTSRVRGDGKHARLAEQAKTPLIGERHPPEASAIHTGDSVMAGKLLVEKRDIGGQEIDDAAIFFQLSIEEERHLPHEGNPEVVVEPRKLRV